MRPNVTPAAEERSAPVMIRPAQVAFLGRAPVNPAGAQPGRVVALGRTVTGCSPVPRPAVGFPGVLLRLPGDDVGGHPYAAFRVTPLVVLRMALERPVVGDVLAARSATEAEAGRVPVVGLGCEVLERGDAQVIAGRAVRSLIQAEGLADLLPGDPVAAGPFGVLAADAGDGLRQNLRGPDVGGRLGVTSRNGRAQPDGPLPDLRAVGLGEPDHGILRRETGVAGAGCRRVAVSNVTGHGEQVLRSVVRDGHLGLSFRSCGWVTNAGAGGHCRAASSATRRQDSTACQARRQAISSADAVHGP